MLLDCYLDTHALPAEIDKIFRRVQDGAHYMPDWQMDVRTSEFLVRLVLPLDYPIAGHDFVSRAQLGL